PDQAGGAVSVLLGDVPVPRIRRDLEMSVRRDDAVVPVHHVLLVWLSPRRDAAGVEPAPVWPGRACTVSVSRPDRRSRPGRSPVKGPSTTTGVPATRTWLTPDEWAVRRGVPAGQSSIVFRPGETPETGSSTEPS